MPMTQDWHTAQNLPKARTTLNPLHSEGEESYCPGQWENLFTILDCSSNYIYDYE